MACNQGPCPTKLPDCTGSRAWSALCTCSEMKLLTFKSCWIAVPCFSQCHWRRESESEHWQLNRSSWLPRYVFLGSIYFAFHMTHLVAVHFMFFRVFSVLQFCSLANFPCSFHCTFLWCWIYTNKHTGWLTPDPHHGRELFGSLLFSPFFLLCMNKVLSEQMLLLNLSKCVFCNRSPTRWLQPLKEEHLYGDASTTFWHDFWIYILIMNSFT